MHADLVTKASNSRDALHERGFATLTGFASPDWLASVRAEIARHIELNGPGDQEIIDPDPQLWPSIDELTGDPRLMQFMQQHVDPASARRGRHEFTNRVLRILDGTGGELSKPYAWHYDGCAVTLVVPLVVPEDGSGELALFPNSRPHRQSSTVSALETALARGAYGRQIQRRAERNSTGAQILPLELGSAYLFRGYRTLHGTLPWPPGRLRVTLVLHYGESHGTVNWLVRGKRALLTARSK